MQLQNTQLLTALLLSAALLQAQPKQPTTTLTAVPRLVRASSSFHPANGSAPAAVESVTLSIYAEEVGGTALWQETQNVSVESDGHYSVLLGSTRNEGLPQELFASGEPRWLGAQFQRPGEVEQPRVLLASVPYALKAADAETLGGRPASSYVVNPSADTSGSAPSGPTEATATAGAGSRAVTSAPRGFISSVLYETPAASPTIPGIGLNTINPLDFFHVKFSDASGQFTGYAVQNTASTGSPYSGMLFWDQNGNLGQFQGFNNLTHEYRINNIARTVWPNGPYNGSIRFLIGGTTVFRSYGDTLTSVGLNALAANFPPTNLTGTDNTAVGYQAGIANNTGSYNTFVGSSAGASNISGNYNTFSGFWAGLNNITGSYNALYGFKTGHNNNADSNSFYGYQAGYTNTSGGSNSFFGRSTAFFNDTGSSNTFLGTTAGYYNVSGSHNTYVGYNAGSNNPNNGSNNTYLGDSAGLSNAGGNNNLYLGHLGVGSESNTIRIGMKGAGAGQQNSVFVDPILLHPWASLDSLVSINNSSGQLGAFAFPNDSTKVLLGNGTFGSLSGGVSANCSPALNYVSKYLAGGTSIGCSEIFDTGTAVGIGTTTPSRQLEVNGDVSIDTSAGSPHHYQFNGVTVLSVDGASNVLTGAGAGGANTGFDNTFTGTNSGSNNVGGDNNSFYGAGAGSSNIAGNSNSFFGSGAGAGTKGNNNTFLGEIAGFVTASGDSNIYVGYAAGQSNSSGNNDIYIGTPGCPGAASGSCSENDTIRIGAQSGTPQAGFNTPSQNTYIAGIYPVVIPNGVAVLVDSTGHLGIGASSRRFKEQIADMGDSSGKLSQLRPVTFLYKPQYDDGSHTLQYGLIAEEVARVYPELVAYDKDGQVMTVKYQELAPMLLNELQKQSAQLRNQAETIQLQQEQNRKLEARFAALETLLSTKVAATAAVGQ